MNKSKIHDLSLQFVPAKAPYRKLLPLVCMLYNAPICASCTRLSWSCHANYEYFYDPSDISGDRNRKSTDKEVVGFLIEIREARESRVLLNEDEEYIELHPAQNPFSSSLFSVSSSMDELDKMELHMTGQFPPSRWPQSSPWFLLDLIFFSCATFTYI